MLLFIIACVGVASSEGDGQRRWSVSDEHVTVNVVSLMHATVGYGFEESWLKFPFAMGCPTSL